MLRRSIQALAEGRDPGDLTTIEDPGALLLVLIVSLSGFASGLTMPSRDMIVREVTPPYFSVKEAVFPFVKFPGVEPRAVSGR